MSDAILPNQKMPKLVVVMAFDLDDDGVLQVVFGPAEQQSEERAIRTAKALAPKHAGVIAYSMDVDEESGDYGTPRVLFESGEVPEL